MSEESQASNEGSGKEKRSVVTLPLVSFIFGAAVGVLTLLFGGGWLQRPVITGSAQSVELAAQGSFSIVMFSLINQFLSEEQQKKLNLNLTSKLRGLGADEKTIARLRHLSAQGTDLSQHEMATHERRLLALAVADLQSDVNSLLYRRLSEAMLPASSVLIVRLENTGRVEAEELEVNVRANRLIGEVVIDAPNNVVSRRIDGETCLISFKRLSPGAPMTVAVWLKSLSKKGADRPMHVTATWRNGFADFPVTELAPRPE